MSLRDVQLPNSEPDPRGESLPPEGRLCITENTRMLCVRVASQSDVYGAETPNGNFDYGVLG